MPLKASCLSCLSCLYNKILDRQLKSLVTSCCCLLIIIIIALGETTTRQLAGSWQATAETIDNKQLTATGTVAVWNRCSGKAQPGHPSLSFHSLFFSLDSFGPGCFSPQVAGPGGILKSNILDFYWNLYTRREGHWPYWIHTPFRITCKLLKIKQLQVMRIGH